MKKEDIIKPRFAIQHDNHQQAITSVLCSMVEHQSLVDVAIKCGNNTIHVHKAIIAANSLYFKEHLEKNAGTEQIIINGLDFSVVKSIIEYMYCGETNVLQDQFKYIIAAASMFKIRGLQSLESEMYVCEDVLDLSADKLIQIPPPTFLTKKPKYSSTYLHFNNPSITNAEKTIQNDINFRKIKRKYMRNEAERACAKEAAASHMALEALKKELATTQVSSFVIEESCTETTVENFIPHHEEAYINNLNQIATVPVQVVNYDLNSPITTNQIIAPSKIMPYGVSANLQKNEESTTDKLKHIIGENLPNNVEIMFKTSDGNFVNVTDEMLQNITRGALQYQVIDENGQASELQDLRVDNKISLLQNEIGTKFVDNVHSFVNTEDSMSNNNHLEHNNHIENDFFSQEKEELQDINKENVYENVCPPKRDIRKSRSMNIFNDYKHSEFMITEHSGSCPIFVPTSLNSRDPLSEACDIAENLSSSEQNKEDHLFSGVHFEEINDNIINDPESNISEKLELEDSKFLLQEKLHIVDQNFVEYSPRKLRSAKQLNVESQVENHDKKFLLQKKKK